MLCFPPTYVVKDHIVHNNDEDFNRVCLELLSRGICGSTLHCLIARRLDISPIVPAVESFTAQFNEYQTVWDGMCRNVYWTMHARRALHAVGGIGESFP